MGFSGLKTVVHLGCLELLTVDQLLMINPDSSDRAGAGSIPGVVVTTAEFWVVMSFTPAA